MSRFNLTKNLKELRFKNSWNQQQVASAIEVSIPAYSKIETGLTDVNLSRLEQLADLYEVSVIELLMGDEPIHSNEIRQLKNQMIQKDQEIMGLQKQVIELYQKFNP